MALVEAGVEIGDPEFDAAVAAFADARGMVHYPSFCGWLDVDPPTGYVDPAAASARLPQPYRMVDKLLRRVLDDAWLVCERRGARPGVAQQKAALRLAGASGAITRPGATCIGASGDGARSAAGTAGGEVRLYDMSTSTPGELAVIPVFARTLAGGVTALAPLLPSPAPDVTPTPPASSAPGPSTWLLSEAERGLLIVAAAVSPDGGGVPRGLVRVVWAPRNVTDEPDGAPRVLAEATASCPLASLAVSPDGRYVAGTTSDGAVSVWQINEAVLLAAGARLTEAQLEARRRLVVADGEGDGEAADKARAALPRPTVVQLKTMLFIPPAPDVDAVGAGAGTGAAAATAAAAGDAGAAGAGAPAASPPPPRVASVQRPRRRPCRGPGRWGAWGASRRAGPCAAPFQA